MTLVHDWPARAEAHRDRVREWTEPYRRRRSRHEVHPVYDFLFQYYPYSMGRLEEWHPNPDEALPSSANTLVGAESEKEALAQRLKDARNVRPKDRFPAPIYKLGEGLLVRDLSAMSPKAVDRLRWTRNLLQETSARRGNFACFGIHEWAMVYRGTDVRHEDAIPLRLTQADVDEVVEGRPISCTHFDAFRFFTPEAKPLNRIQPELHTREAIEQPGCIHANMDLYKWAYKSMPWVGSDIVWKTFSLAIELRTLDMQASPYDLVTYGFEPVLIETDEGRGEYRRRQEDLSEKAQVLRRELIDQIDTILSDPTLTAMQPSDRPSTPVLPVAS